jgi:hypothetical protein
MSGNTFLQQNVTEKKKRKTKIQPFLAATYLKPDPHWYFKQSTA